jgi:phosphoglycerate dehydrogenase-like enzyme
MTPQNISVVGLGTLGTQIAIQAAAYGHRVSGYDPNPPLLVGCRQGA